MIAKTKIQELSVKELRASVSYYETENYFEKDLLPVEDFLRIHFDCLIVMDLINERGVNWFSTSVFNRADFFDSLEKIQSPMGAVLHEMLSNSLEISNEMDTPYWLAYDDHYQNFERWFEKNRSKFEVLEVDLMPIYSAHFAGKFDVRDDDDILVIS